MYHSSQNRSDYAPCLCANGSLSLSPNADGSVCEEPSTIEKQNFWCFGSHSIYRAGRRMYLNRAKGISGDLLTFGSFSFDCGSSAESFDQELSLPDGVVKSVCRYSDGSVIESLFFTHFCKNVYVLKKKYCGVDKKLAFRYDFPTHREVLKSAYRECKSSPFPGGFRTDFYIEGADSYRGFVNVFLDRDVKPSKDGDFSTLSFDVADGDEFTFYLTTADNLDSESERSFAESLSASSNFDTLYREHTGLWREYFSKGGASTGDETVDGVYMTALYHMKCGTTEWSIPVGINDSTWHGRYFAFDEFYGFHGLLTSAQTDLAKHVPYFRLHNCLEKAIHRATYYSDEQARFMWETAEYGDENTVNGVWLDHVFHMAVVALGAYEYYEYTLDREFLSECYRMIRACAKFYTETMIYHDSVRGAYFGKCCDLERLGTSRENAFMSSCGAVCTLKICADAADILDVDPEYAAECRETAGELLKSLPNDGEKYIPFDGASLRSIGVYAGIFPFDVLGKDDKKLLAAMADYALNESEYGNMYRTGKGVSSWYAAWKAAAYARCGMAKEAWAAIRQACASCGVFGELYEINESDDARCHPWFMTAAGMLLTAVNESLVQSDGENVYLLPAYDGESAKFKLAVQGGAVCEAEIENRRVKKLAFTFRDGVEKKRFRVFLDGREIMY